MSKRICPGSRKNGMMTQRRVVMTKRVCMILAEEKMRRTYNLEQHDAYLGEELEKIAVSRKSFRSYRAIQMSGRTWNRTMTERS